MSSLFSLLLPVSTVAGVNNGWSLGHSRASVVLAFTGPLPLFLSPPEQLTIDQLGDSVIWLEKVPVSIDSLTERPLVHRPSPIAHRVSSSSSSFSSLDERTSWHEKR